jgi:anaerobic magnesium-protoporphyrin IX monomethyl ester cyclase
LAGHLAEAVGRQWEPLPAVVLREALAFDLARCERIVPGQLLMLFDTSLGAEELGWVAAEVRQAAAEVRGQGVKLQYFAAVFRHLPGTAGRTVCLFLYRIRSGAGMVVAERRFTAALPA